MIIEDLEKKISLAKQAGKKPMLVNATCGTTVFGAYDPVEAIADVCEKNEMWLHIDVRNFDTTFKILETLIYKSRRHSRSFYRLLFIILQGNMLRDLSKVSANDKTWQEGKGFCNA